MRAGSTMFVISLLVLVLVFLTCSTSDRKQAQAAAAKIVSIVKSNINILLDRANGIEAFEVETYEEDDFVIEDDTPDSGIGEEGIYESDKTLKVDVKLDGG